MLAAVADGQRGSLGVVLSLPGIWIAGAVLTAALASRASQPTDRVHRSAHRGRAASGAVAAAAFLLAGMAAYYAGKQVLTGSIPGPLAVFWVALAGAVGLVGGAAAGRISAEPWGVAALAASVAGWLLVEAAAVPAAPWTEAALAVLIGACVAAFGHCRRLGPWIGGVGVGAAGAVVVLAVLPDALTLIL